MRFLATPLVTILWCTPCQNKRRILASAMKNLLLIVCFVIQLAACGRDPHFTALPAKANVVILGDSLTYGTGANKGEDYASVLAAKTGWHIVNAGVPGNTSSDGLERLPAILAEGHIDLLIVELGGNDFIRHVPVKETTQHLKTILAQAKAQHIPTLLLAIPEFSPFGAAVGHLSDHPVYEKIAKETQTPLVEDIFSEVLGNYALKADPLHPNADGYRIVAENLYQALIKLGFLTQR